ncbi:MAG: metallophosphoesterase family protein [Fimbriimonadales bacterium]
MRKGLATIFLAAIAALSIPQSEPHASQPSHIRHQSSSGWCFVVAGDGRTNDQTPDPTGINMLVMKKLVEAMNAEHPRFMLWTGDLVHGEYGKVTTPITQQLGYWKQAITGLQGVTVLPVRGNHETYGDTDGTIWLRLMKPYMDAAKVSYFKDEEGFSYSFTPTNDPKIAIVAVDQFIHEHRVNLPEFERALKKARDGGAKNIFVFAHEMAFTCDNHGDNDNMGKFKADRDAFVELLEMYGVQYFFAGHDHAYDWMEIKDKKWSPQYTLNQIVAGTAGAPFYTDKSYFGDHGGYELTRKDHKDGTFGYMLVEVDDNERVTVTFKEIKP